MEINDYLKIANDYATKHNKDESFILMGLYKLIQDTDLKKLHAHSLFSEQGDGSFGLITPQSHPTENNVTMLSKIIIDKTGASILSIDKDKNNVGKDIIYGLEEDHALVRRFNDDLQNVESFFDLKDVYTFDEITRIKHLMNTSVSLGFALELISQNNESSETGKYNDFQTSYLKKAAMAEYSNHNKSKKFEIFSNNGLSELSAASDKLPLTPNTFFTELNLNAQTTFTEMSGFGHINLIEEDLEDLINDDALFINNSFVGSLFKLDTFRDVMISYFDYNELDDVKFEFGLMTESFLEHPTIEDILVNNDKFKNVDDMLMDVYSKHPELNYSIQDISIITDNEISSKNELIEHQVDKFHFYASNQDIHNLGPNQQDRRVFLSKYKLYGESILKQGDGRVRFISSNQFAADAVLSASYYFNESPHNEISIDSIVINPQLSNEHITELFESIVDYAEKNKSILMITHEKLAWGGINKDRLMDIIHSVVENSASRVPILCKFGIEKDREHFALNYLVNSKECSYEDLPKLFKKLKTFIDSNPTLDDLQLEFKMDEFIAKERIKSKTDIKSSI